MSGRSKEGKHRHGKQTVNRRRDILRHERRGITKPFLHRLARRGGIQPILLPRTMTLCERLSLLCM